MLSLALIEQRLALSAVGIVELQGCYQCFARTTTSTTAVRESVIGFSLSVKLENRSIRTTKTLNWFPARKQGTHNVFSYF
jgi:hypothetical protein